MEGIELVRTIRAHEKLADMPALMVTTEVRIDQIVAAAQAGISGYVVKPCKAQTLSEKIDGIFDRIEAAA